MTPLVERVKTDELVQRLRQGIQLRNKRAGRMYVPEMKQAADCIEDLARERDAMAKELVELAGENARLRTDVAEWECLDAEAKHGAEEMTARAEAAEKALREISAIAGYRHEDFVMQGPALLMSKLRRIAVAATLTRSTKLEGQK